MAVGISSDATRQKTNLTQLRRNEMKKADRISGRKLSKLDNVDVVVVCDVNKEVMQELQAAVQDVEPSRRQLKWTTAEIC